MTNEQLLRMHLSQLNFAGNTLVLKLLGTRTVKEYAESHVHSSVNWFVEHVILPLRCDDLFPTATLRVLVHTFGLKGWVPSASMHQKADR